MNTVLKWILVIVGAVVLLLAIAVLVLPRVIDVAKYRPQIEAQVAKATGRTFRLGGDLEPSLFPWVGVRLSDLHLGNPAGFKEQDFVAVESFEVRVKLLPLLSRTIEVKRFVVNRPVIVLEKRKDGKGGWEGLGRPAEKTPAKKEEKPAPASSGEMPIKSVQVGEFAITDGRVVWLDQASDTRKEVRNIDLVLTNVSLDKPIGVAFSALADQKPVKLDGTIGPLGGQPGKSPLTMAFALKLLEQLNLNLSGRVDPSVTPPRFDLAVKVAEFSPRRLMEALGQPLPLTPADPKVLEAVALSLSIKGSPESVAVSDGRLTLDDSHATFSAQASELAKPNLKLELNLDRIDLDRYLPAPAAEAPGAAPATPAPPDKPIKKTDYGPLRRLVLDARFNADELKAKNARVQNLTVRVHARDGVFQLDPLKLGLYQGSLAGTGQFDVRKDAPAISLVTMLNGVQAGPMVKDLAKKDIIEGLLAAELSLNFTGDTPALIRQTLGGKGDLRFNDGAVVGVDLASMVRNVQAAFGLAQQPSEKPRTDFSELQLPFTITDGLFRTDASRLVSPLLRVLATGTADLAKETLDFRVEPKFVATIQGQGDTAQRSGLMVPVLVTGSFAAPAFKPDIKGILSQQLDQPLPSGEQVKEELRKLIPPEENRQKAIEEGVKGLLKQLGKP